MMAWRITDPTKISQFLQRLAPEITQHKKMLKMKDDPFMCLKTQAGVDKKSDEEPRFLAESAGLTP
jgi:hypothetical protein